MRDHLALAEHAFDQQFQLAAGGLLAEQARLDHLGVVEHQQVAGRSSEGSSRKMRSTGAAPRAIEQARGAAFGGGVLGDQLGRQGEIEVAEGEGAHALEGWTGPCQGWREAELSHARHAPQAPCPTRRRRPCSSSGLARDIDLALHLPLRYEDETRIVKLRDAREGDTAQIEATVTACEVAYRPRRQLVVTVDDGSDTCVLRFFSFYPSQQKALAVGTRRAAARRAQGRLPGLADGASRPSSAAGGELPTALTPVYPTVASLPQAYLRKAVLGGLARADLSDTFPPGVTETLRPRWCGACARR